MVRSGKMRCCVAGLLVVMAGWLVGCMGGPQYFRLPLDLGKIGRVAVMPIENLARETSAGEKVRRMVIAELLAEGRLDVVEPGTVDRVLRQLQVGNRYRLSPEEIQRVGEALGARAIMTGSVSEYSMTRAGGSLEAPEVAIELFLIDVSSGNIVWSASDSASGLDFWVRHFGAEPLRVSEQADRVVHAMLTTLSARPTRQPFPENAQLLKERARRKELADARGGREKRMKAMEEMLVVALREQIQQRVAQVRRSEDALRVLCSMDVFFDYGKVTLSNEGQQVIERLGRVLKERGAGQAVEVAVFPEESELSEEVQSRYGSIWELSAARAVTLLQQLEKLGLDPARLKASYFGAMRAKREASERVEITVLFPLAEENKPPEAIDLSGGI